MKREDWEFCAKCGKPIGECTQCPDAHCPIREFEEFRRSIPWKNRHPQNLLPAHVQKEWKADLETLALDGAVQIDAVHKFLAKYLD